MEKAFLKSALLGAKKYTLIIHPLYKKLNICAFLCLLLIPLSSQANDLYITTVDLNLRTGAGKSFKSILVINKGDTVTYLNDAGKHWVKLQYQGKIGYSSKKYLKEVEQLTPIKTVPKSEPDYNSSFFLFSSALFIALAISLIKTGKRYRKKSTATVLSLFFGLFGLQKFYLGDVKKGALSVLFCWTLIPAFIGVIDFLKLILMKEERFQTLYNRKYGFHMQEDEPTYNPRNTTVSTPEIAVKKTLNIYTPKHQDESIIEVQAEDLDLSIDQEVEESYNSPPYWGHAYVYSYDEITQATPAQRAYYNHFKERVLNGEFVDIEGQSNYAFILYFDFLNEYQKHKDIKLLEEQFNLLGIICPKTRSYSQRSLQEEVRKTEDFRPVDQIQNLEPPSFEFDQLDDDPNSFKLGSLYKNKLKLTEEEVSWLNKFYIQSNVFTSIEGCCIAIIKQYLIVLKKLEKSIQSNSSTLSEEIAFFSHKLKTVYISNFSEYGYYDADSLNQKAESDIYLMIFKRVENSVREHYGHKRKVSGDFPSTNLTLAAEFEDRMGTLLNQTIQDVKKEIIQPDFDTEVALNIQNVNRWKVKFNVLKDRFKKEAKDQFLQEIMILEETNQKNPNIENIFFEASKFIAKYDKVQALNYYAKYIYYDLKSKKFDKKDFTKTVKKSLFQTEDQINDFKEIIAELIQTADIKTATEKIAKIYIPKRKKIQLDHSKIKEVEQKHEGTVELLSEYLEEDDHSTPSMENNDVEVAIVPTSDRKSIFKPEIHLDQIQEELIALIVNNSFEIPQLEVEKYATAHSLFKNQFIDSINEACAERLDGEVLIEEDEDSYIIEESYYHEIII